MPRTNGATLAFGLALALGCSTPGAGPPRPAGVSGRAELRSDMAATSGLPAEGRGVATAVTYAGRVRGILGDHCVECHRDGGIGPFPLTTYEEARGRARRLARVVREGRMPPWFASPEYGEWKNDRRLPEADRRDLLAWVDAGMPRGDEPSGDDEPGGPPSNWALGRAPDAVIRIPEPMEIPAEGVLPYQYVFVKTDFAEDRWIRALELRPTAYGVTHHVAAFLQGPDDEERGPYLTLWTGRTQPTAYPAGVAKRLPAGAWIMFELHYATNGEPATDRTELGLVFAGAAPDREATTLAVATRSFGIPPHAEDYPVVAEMPFWRGGEILSLLPHMHRRGKAFRVEIRRADGSSEILLDVPRYDFRWQLSYEFATPLRVEPGDVLRAWAWYDNSAGNPANPDPEAIVYHGPQDFEEMMAGFFEWVGDPVQVDVGEPLIILPDTSSTEPVSPIRDR